MPFCIANHSSGSATACYWFAIDLLLLLMPFCARDGGHRLVWPQLTTPQALAELAVQRGDAALRIQLGDNALAALLAHDLLAHLLHGKALGL